jgi:hypothetical protein
MKKLIYRSFLYAMLALAGGVFYREFTRWNGFTGRTSLAFVHLHLFVLGALLLLISVLFSGSLPLLEMKRFRIFLKLHTIGLPYMVIMMLVRGVMQVSCVNISGGLDAAVSGIAGLGHIILGTSLVYFYLALRDALSHEPKK